MSRLDAPLQASRPDFPVDAPLLSAGTTVVPGMRVASKDKWKCGRGVHIWTGAIRANTIGVVQHDAATQTVSILPGYCLAPPLPRSESENTLATATEPSVTLPQVGMFVFANVVRVQRKQALCNIFVLETPGFTPRVDPDWDLYAGISPHLHVTSFGFRGILRAQDVRATEVDKVRMGECFRVGDTIRAKVISLGDQGGYYLGTAGNDLGVVLAFSEAGNLCVPVSWCEVRDEMDGSREKRKVAKIW